ncbi:hypothetical protein BDQ17DRAFT_1259653, partial [Cyathus striatus]
QKKVTILSIIMQSSNQKTNALENIIGIFLHVCKTPEKVIEALVRLGISVSLNMIHAAITSLSMESADTLHKMGQTHLVAYAYDNLDVDLKTSVPTIEKSTTTLKHLTSALIFPCQHSVTKEDMKCSKELWSKCCLNPHANPADIPPAGNWKNVIQCITKAHPDPILPGQLSHHQKFNSSIFLTDLCTHSPKYFSQFLDKIIAPEGVDMIPHTKTPIIPARSMEFSNSTVSGNISTILDLMEQGGVAPIEPSEAEEFEYEIENDNLHIVLFHGDLGTGDRILSIQLHRSIEKTPYNRFEFVAFNPGYFHVKMACAETFQQNFILPAMNSYEDNTSFMGDIRILRLKQTGMFASKPGFRKMHQVIRHSGICR